MTNFILANILNKWLSRSKKSNKNEIIFDVNKPNHQVMYDYFSRAENYKEFEGYFQDTKNKNVKASINFTDIKTVDGKKCPYFVTENYLNDTCLGYLMFLREVGFNNGFNVKYMVTDSSDPDPLKWKCQVGLKRNRVPIENAIVKV